jgi:hypothetical protein
MLVLLLLIHLACYADSKRVGGNFLYCVDDASPIDFDNECEATNQDYDNDSKQLIEIDCQQTLNDLQSYSKFNDLYFEYNISDETNYFHSIDKNVYPTSCTLVEWIEIPEKVNLCTELVFAKWVLDGYKYEGFLNPLGFLVPSSLSTECESKIKQFTLANNDNLRIFQFYHFLIIADTKTNQNVKADVLFRNEKRGRQFDDTSESKEAENETPTSRILHTLSTIRPQLSSIFTEPAMHPVAEIDWSQILFGPIGAVLLALSCLLVLILLITTCKCCVDSNDPEDGVDKIAAIEEVQEANEEKSVQEQAPEFDLNNPKRKKKKKSGHKSFGSRFLYSFVSL